jgi:hypothetical protein
MASPIAFRGSNETALGIYARTGAHVSSDVQIGISLPRSIHLIRM